MSQTPQLDDAKTGRVQAGATWGGFDHEAQAFGLATPGVTVSTVGVAGSTLGGGTAASARTATRRSRRI